VEGKGEGDGEEVKDEEGGGEEEEDGGEEWWPVEVVSFPNAGEDALRSWAELVTVHVSLWLVPRSEQARGVEVEVGRRSFQLSVPAPPPGLTHEEVYI
jgi:hypothetical protein